MINERTAKLEIDIALGNQKQEIYQNHIKPFIEAKEKILFEAFESIPATDVKTLQSIKLQQTAIRSLAAYFKEYIDTGKMAKFELENIQ